MNVYTLLADGNYYRKRIFHHALATETNRVMIDVDGVVKENVNLNFMKGEWNSISVDLSNKTASARICLQALATKNDVDGIVKEKKMLLKSAKNYDSDPWFLTHLSVLLLWKASEIQYPSEFYFQACVLTICGNAKDCITRSVSEWCQGAKKIIFTACHSGKLKLASTSLDVILTGPKNLLTSRIDFTVFCHSNSSKNLTCPSSKLKTEFTSPIAKSTSPGLSDSTFFAHWMFSFALLLR